MNDEFSFHLHQSFVGRTAVKHDNCKLIFFRKLVKTSSMMLKTEGEKRFGRKTIIVSYKNETENDIRKNLPVFRVRDGRNNIQGFVEKASENFPFRGETKLQT